MNFMQMRSFRNGIGITCGNGKIMEVL
jgi:hypothetical protein